MQQPAEHAEHDGHHAPAASWLTIAEAAAALGVSVDTVRRRLKRGQLQAEQVQTERGPVWRVSIDTLHSVPSTPSSNGQSTPGMPSSAAEHAVHDQQRPELLKALDLLERAQGEVVAKAEAAAMWQTRAELLALQLRQAQERILALEAPSEPTSVEMTTGGLTEGLTVETDQEPSQSKRAWWRFW